jgi:hypothetical protein
MTQVPVVVNGKTIPPGGYTMFIDLTPNAWTLIVSTWQPQKQFNPSNREASGAPTATHRTRTSSARR